MPGDKKHEGKKKKKKQRPKSMRPVLPIGRPKLVRSYARSMGPGYSRALGAPARAPQVAKFTNREFVGTVRGSVDFDTLNYTINAANPALFPWLSRIAQSYQQYDFEKLEIEFVSSSSNALNSTNTALGSVVMVTQYDTQSPAFDSFSVALSTQGATQVKPSISSKHRVETKVARELVKWRYCRQSSLAGSGDSRLYDTGLFQFMTEGMQAAAVIGNLWVNYTVAFTKPVYTPLGKQIGETIYARDGGTTWSVYGVVLSPVATTLTPINNTTVQVTWRNSDKGDAYLVIWDVLSAASVGTPSITITGGFFASSSSGTVTFPSIAQDATTLKAIRLPVCSGAQSTPMTVTFSYATNPPGTAQQLRIYQISSNFPSATPVATGSTTALAASLVSPIAEEVVEEKSSV